MLAATAALAAMGCSNDDGSTPSQGGKTEFDTYTHAQLLKLEGRVKQVKMTYQVAEEESLLKLDASFDAQGRCTSYDPTGLEFEPEATAKRKATRGWGVSFAHYTYTYDAQGRMSSVTKNEVGSDPIVYEITYGTHKALVVAPFPLGDITPFMLRGVSRIAATNYELTCDGETAVETAAAIGWGASITQTGWAYKGSRPVHGMTTVYARLEDGKKGEELRHIETAYTYQGDWISKSEQTTTEPIDEQTFSTRKSSTQYSTTWPCTPLSREVTSDDGQESYRIEFAYMENGQPKSAKIVSGMSFNEEEFEQHYLTYDEAGNWTRALRTSTESSGAEFVVDRTLSYY